MATSAPAADVPRAPARPGAGEVLDAVAFSTAGAGIGFITFLAAVPGLLPCVLLVALAAAILMIPLLVVGAVLGGLGGVAFLATRGVMRRLGRRRERQPAAAAAAATPGRLRAAREGSAPRREAATE